MEPDGRLPVLVGVGVANQDIDDPTASAEAVELMVQAARAAADDAGVPSVLSDAERIAVPQGTWKYRDPARLIAKRVGADRARTVLVDLGIPQQRLINDALASISAGELDVAVVVGGETKRRDALARRAGVELAITSQADDVTPDDWQRPVMGEIVAQAEIKVGLVVPVQQYALIESALGAAERQALDDQQVHIADLWTRFNVVARSNPDAAFPEPRDAEFLRTASPENRPLAFPYNKWHATQWTVDQSAALLLMSVEAARRYGVNPDRWVFPHVGLDSSAAFSLSNRTDMHRWPAMEGLGRAAAAHVGRPMASVEMADLYSCFPVAVRVQQRELGLPLDGTPTVTGGMAFAGGPFNNYVLQSTVAMAQRLRDDPAAMGLVSTVSGLLTKPGLALWSTQVPAVPLVGDLADDARAATPTLESVPDYVGAASVAASTVTYDGDVPARVIVIGDTPDGRRCVAVADDQDLAARATTERLTGTPIDVNAGTFRV
jgi:acetyl-CoA C-acetyltransferase